MWEFYKQNHVVDINLTLLMMSYECKMYDAMK